MKSEEQLALMYCRFYANTMFNSRNKKIYRKTAFHHYNHQCNQYNQSINTIINNFHQYNSINIHQTLMDYEKNVRNLNKNTVNT